ncbi:hypothetical protein Misp06_01416 [Microbulbifer sp. NBRC 101763]|uniref:SixA phosphatase family protein n=1 Tax=Microbulbifer TaxID=48073 RepID=UPI000368AE27|nr:phosphoglycerate mutase family protein [Microbulbifer variabilis]
MLSRLTVRFTCALLALFGMAAWAESETAITDSQVIYLVRHAEKQRGLESGINPHLTEAGRQRAKQLARVLGEVGIDAVYSTDYVRTKETAEPLAAELGLPIQTYNPRKLKEFARQFDQAGKRVLVVGHSNTTPKLVELLGGDKGRPIRELDEYDRLYIVIRNRGDVTTLLQRYGADSSAKAERKSKTEAAVEEP